MVGKIKLAKSIEGRTKTNEVEVDVNFIPRVGDYVDHEKSGINGYVAAVTHWMPEGGSEFIIEVRIK